MGASLSGTGRAETNIGYANGTRVTAALPPAPKTLPSIYDGAGGGAAVAKVYAPKLDVAAINAKARASAEGAVNPWYTLQLNNFLAEQSAQKQQQQTRYDTNVKNLEDTLKNNLEQNDITRGRTGEDVATNIAGVNQAADEFQTDSGQDFDKARLDLARTASTGGLGAQKVAEQQAGRNTQEGRQVQKFEKAKQEQELFKTRTFDDLARSGKLAGESTEKGKTAAKFDLDSYLQNAAFDETNQRNTLEKGRQSDIEAKSQSYARDAYNEYIRNIADPAQRLAGAQQYGSSF